MQKHKRTMNQQIRVNRLYNQIFSNIISIKSSVVLYFITINWKSIYFVIFTFNDRYSSIIAWKHSNFSKYDNWIKNWIIIHIDIFLIFLEHISWELKYVTFSKFLILSLTTKFLSLKSMENVSCKLKIEELIPKAVLDSILPIQRLNRPEKYFCFIQLNSKILKCMY